MKKFGTSNLPFRVGAGGTDIPDNDDQELENTTNQFCNNMYSEPKSLIESSGQTLTETTGEDINQTAKAVFLYSGKASYFTAEDSTANNKILSSYNTGFVIPNFNLFDGFEFRFINKVTNTGDVTVLINGSSQSQALPLKKISGEELNSGDLPDGVYCSIRYIQPLNEFVLFSSTGNNNAIVVYPSVPQSKQGDLIWVDPFGLMRWNTKWSMYRSIEAARKVNGWSVDVAAGHVLADGSYYSKSGNYKGLWTAALDGGLVLGPANWHLGQYIFIDVDADTFRVPDLRGYHDRNASMGSVVDAGRIIFSGQHDAIRNITGNFYAITAGSTGGVFARSNGTQKTSTTNGGLWYESTTFLDASLQVPVGADNHPHNTAYPGWIKI